MLRASLPATSNPKLPEQVSTQTSGNGVNSNSKLPPTKELTQQFHRMNKVCKNTSMAGLFFAYAGFMGANIKPHALLPKIALGMGGGFTAFSVICVLRQGGSLLSNKLGRT